MKIINIKAKLSFMRGILFSVMWNETCILVIDVILLPQEHSHSIMRVDNRDWAVNY